MALLFDLMAKGIAIANTNRHVQTEARQFDLIAPLLILLRSFHHQCESDEVVNLNYRHAQTSVSLSNESKAMGIGWPTCTDRLLSQNADSLSSIGEGPKVKLISWWKLGPIIACVKVQVAVFYLECVRMRILTCTVFDAV